MPKNVIMPALGVAQETGRLLKWFKAEGEQVRQSEMLLEIETDKAVVEIEAPASGVLLNVTAHPGDEVPVGTVIAEIRAEGEVETATSIQISKYESSPGGSVKPPAGVLAKGETANPAECEIANTESADASRYPQPRQTGQSALSRGRVPSSPKARRLAAERGIDLRSLATSEADGPVVAASIAQASIPSKQAGQATEVSRVWRLMADRTLEAWKTIPHFYLVRDVDTGNLQEWRESLRRSVPEITFTDLLVKKVATCLQSHPFLNSEWRNGSIKQHTEINIGLAVGIDQGLVVPVIRDADKLAVAEIMTQRSRLVTRAQQRKLGPDELSSGTFTISNLGMYGVDSFQAIVNSPQAAILAIGRIAQRVVPLHNQPALRPMMTLTLSCDHRLVDGVHAARFLGDLATSIEQVSSAEI